MSTESVLYRRILPLIVTIGVVAVLFLEYYTGITIINNLAKEVTLWSTIVGLFGILVGAFSLILLNARYIERKTPGRWIYALIMLVTFAGYIILGLYDTTSGPTYLLLFNNINIQLQNAMMGVLGFYFIIGAYRALKFRNIESAAFGLSLFFILLMIAPIGPAIWTGFSDIGNWIQMVPNKAAIRGILICVALGTIILAYRTLLGREKSYLGG